MINDNNDNKITEEKHVKLWLRKELLLKAVPTPGFLLSYMVISTVFCMIMPTCFKDYDFGITEFILYCH